MLGSRPPQFEVLSVAATDDPLALLPAARELVEQLDTGDGVLIFSDIYGATPCNLAGKLLQPGRVEGIAGVNLPMLVRALHLPHARHGHDGQARRCPAAATACCTSTSIRSMQQREVEIVNKLGLHARASAKLTQLAAKYQSDVVMSRNGRKVNAKSIMGVMMLAAGKGAKVTLETDGPDEARGDGGDRRADRRLFRRGPIAPC